jgi:putative transposase
LIDRPRNSYSRRTRAIVSTPFIPHPTRPEHKDGQCPCHARQGVNLGRRSRHAQDQHSTPIDRRLLRVNLTPADISDNAGAKAVLRALRARWPWMRTLFADSAHDRAGLMDEAAMLDFTVEVVRKIEGQSGFQALPRRWVVERTFAWMTRWRRAVRDHEARLDVSEAMTQIAMARLLIRRVSH